MTKKGGKIMLLFLPAILVMFTLFATNVEAGLPYSYNSITLNCFNSPIKGGLGQAIKTWGDFPTNQTGYSSYQIYRQDGSVWVDKTFIAKTGNAVASHSNQSTSGHYYKSTGLYAFLGSGVVNTMYKSSKWCS
jgi:hypothetical protein